MNDTVVILCKTADDALRAEQRISLIPNITKFFLFISNEPDIADLDWLNESDIYVYIEKPSVWSKNIIHLGLRMGICYTNGENIYVCESHACPNLKEIEDTRKICDSAIGTHQTSKLLGMSRAYFASHYELEITQKESTSKNTLALQCARALKGQESTPEGIVEAIFETAPLTSVVFEQKPENTNLSYIHSLLNEKLSPFIHPRGESKITYSENKSPKELIDLIFNTSSSACLIFIYNKEQEKLFDLSKAYRRLYTNTCCAAIFKGESK